MRHILVKAILMAAVSVISVLGADSSLGTWKLNMDKSKFTASAPVENLTTMREASDNGVKVTTTGEQADGTPINASYTAKYDGKTYPVMGAPFDSIAITQVDANTFTMKQKSSANKRSTTTRSVVSKNGKTMTNRVRGTGADGRRVNYTMVYDKQ